MTFKPTYRKAPPIRRFSPLLKRPALKVCQSLLTAAINGLDRVWSSSGRSVVTRLQALFSKSFPLTQPLNEAKPEPGRGVACWDVVC